jgi:outer membrane lipoprotein carrier protein
MLKHVLFVLSMSLGLTGALASESPEAGADSAAAGKLQRYLHDLTTFEARFTQTIVGAQSAGEQSSGRFYLHRPGRLRWDYVRPHTQIIVTDGLRLWVYDKDLNQVTVRAIDRAMATTPAMLLAGEASVLDSFRITAGESRQDADAGLEWIRMLPRSDDTDFLSVELGFADGELRQMELRDKLGQTTRIAFSGIRRNARLNEKLFQFEPPRGADVIGTLQ